MEIDDFHRNFYLTTVCHYKPNYQNITVSDCHSIVGHAVSRLDVEADIVGLGVTFILT